MRTLVMGDIHGGYKALMQCLERSKFDYEKDTLIQLGDICDGWSDREMDTLEVEQECTWEQENIGLLQVIYEDGKFFNQTTLEEVREKLLNCK